MSVRFSIAASECLSRGKSQQEADANRRVGEDMVVAQGNSIGWCSHLELAAPGSCYSLWAGAGGGGSSYCQNLPGPVVYNPGPQPSAVRVEGGAWGQHALASLSSILRTSHKCLPFSEPSQNRTVREPDGTTHEGQSPRTQKQGRKEGIPGGHGKVSRAMSHWDSTMLPCLEHCWAQSRGSEMLKKQSGTRRRLIFSL